MQISLQAHNLAGCFVRHSFFQGEVNPITEDLGRADATFTVEAGLADGRFLTLRSFNHPDRVWRHENSRLVLHPAPQGDDAALRLYREDATFVLTPGLADPTKVSLRSLNFPDRFLRHRDFHLWVEPVPDELGRNDATFTMGPGFLPQFSYVAAITTEQRSKLVERHRAAVAAIARATSLTGEEKTKLHAAYRKSISHGINTDPNANASAPLGGSSMKVNFGNLFPLGDREIAQSLIHEMTHSAGYTHPDRRDPVAPQSCAAPDATKFDCPYDNGQYYGTAPLRAELAIAGVQSLIAEIDLGSACTVDADGLATIAGPRS